MVVIPVGFPPCPAARRRGWRRRHGPRGNDLWLWRPRRRGRRRRRGSKRWLAHIFRVRGGSSASGEWRHCAISWREGRGAEGERSATATFLSRRTAQSPALPRPRRDGWGERDGCDDNLARSGLHGRARVRDADGPGGMGRRWDRSRPRAVRIIPESLAFRPLSGRVLQLLYCRDGSV